jgi:hypothetical protein
VNPPRIVTWGAFGLLGVLFVFACLSPRPFPAAPAVVAVALPLVWLFKELPDSVRLRKRGEPIDETAPDWPQPVPLGPEPADEVAEPEPEWVELPDSWADFVPSPLGEEPDRA